MGTLYTPGDSSYLHEFLLNIDAELGFVKIQVSVLLAANGKTPKCAEFSKFFLCITSFWPLRNTGASN